MGWDATFAADAVSPYQYTGAHFPEVYKRFTLEETEKVDPHKVLDRFETYCYGYGNSHYTIKVLR